MTCVCARHARKVLSDRVNKSDPLDAEGLAQMARTGWFKAVHIKAEATHLDRASLNIHQQLVDSRLAMGGQLDNGESALFVRPCHRHGGQSI